MTQQKLMCYSQVNFKSKMVTEKWLTNEDLPKNVAIISICNSKDTICVDEYHMFKDAKNVLNLDFDDLAPGSGNLPEGTTKMDLGNGRYAICFSKKMAEKAVKFIEKNIDCDFYIHCAAGISRSQAFVRFIQTNYNRDWYTSKRNPCQYPNGYVVKMLNEQKRKIDGVK